MNNKQPKQQTAIEWYHYTMELLLEYENLRLKNAYKKILREAKQMEKKQMKKIAEYWHFNGIPDEHFEEYYNEIYNK